MSQNKAILFCKSFAEQKGRKITNWNRGLSLCFCIWDNLSLAEKPFLCKCKFK